MDDNVWTIGNEFAMVKLRKVTTRNGERLEIEAPKVGTKVYLDSIILEMLSAQPAEVFSYLMSDPFVNPENLLNDVNND